MSEPQEDEDADEAARAEHLAVRKRAMDLLARREHARAELRGKLVKRDHVPERIDTVLDELIADGLLSDARYAEAAVSSKAGRGIGPVRIRAELAAVDVPDADIENALAAAAVDWDGLAESVRVKRFGAALPEDFPTKAKQMRFLQRRGFDAEQLQAAFDG